MARVLDESWKGWLDENLARGCAPDELRNILLQNGFAPAAVREAMGAAHPPEAGPEVDHRAISEARITRPGSGAQKVETDLLQLYVLDDFLDPTECETLIRVSSQSLRPSTLTDGNHYDGYRTSSTSDLSLLTDPFIEEIDRKIGRALGIRLAYAEGIQAQRYEVGQEFQRHTDYFQPGTEEYQRFGGPQGNRTWTFMVYLNTVERGGGTRFFSIDRTFAAERGRALAWNNLGTDGTPNPDTLHAGLPVEAGHKIIITKWFRELGVGPMFHEAE